MVGLRTQLSNQLRGFLGEYGIVLPQGLSVVMREVPAIASDPERDRAGEFRALLCMQHKALMQADEQVADLSAMLVRESKENPLCERLRSIPGIGPMVSTALVASVGNGWAFGSGRQMSAYLGLVPRQSSTGGRTKLLGIGKRGDRYTAGSADPRCTGGAAHGPQGRADPSQGVGIGRQAAPGSERGHGGGGQQAGADRLGGAQARGELQRRAARRRSNEGVAGSGKRPETQRTNQGRIAPPSSLRGLERAMARQVGPRVDQPGPAHGPSRGRLGVKRPARAYSIGARELERRDSHQQAGYHASNCT